MPSPDMPADMLTPEEVQAQIRDYMATWDCNEDDARIGVMVELTGGDVNQKRYNPDQPRYTEGTPGGLGGQWRSLIEGAIADECKRAMADLPVSAGPAPQIHDDPQGLYDSAERQQPGFERILNLGAGIAKDLDAETHRLFERGHEDTFSPDMLAEAGRAVMEHPERNHVILAARKERPRFMEKVQKKYDGHAAKITDLVRGAILVNDPLEIDHVIQTIKKHANEHGWHIAEGEQTLAVTADDPHRPPGKYTSAYRDAKILLRAPDGQVAEIQVLPTWMWLAKDGPHGAFEEEPDTNGHELYEAQRSLDPYDSESDAKLWTELQDRQRRLYRAAWKKVVQQTRKLRQTRR